jgi:cholera toxin transcriptional activator
MLAAYYVLVLDQRGEYVEYVEYDLERSRLIFYSTSGVIRRVSLGSAEAILLKYLIERPAETISRQVLLDAAWPGRVVQEGSLSQAISTLRAILGDEQRREVIRTVPRRGYQIDPLALLDREQWTLRKEALLNPPVLPASDELASEEVGPPVSPERIRRHWSVSYLIWTVATILAFLLFSCISRYYYTVMPDYVASEFSVGKARVTLVSFDDESFLASKEALKGVFQKMDNLGGGKILVNRMRNYYELNCLREDRTLYTLMVHEVKLYSISEEDLRRCLK